MNPGVTPIGSTVNIYPPPPMFSTLSTRIYNHHALIIIMLPMKGWESSLSPSPITTCSKYFHFHMPPDVYQFVTEHNIKVHEFWEIYNVVWCVVRYVVSYYLAYNVQSTTQLCYAQILLCFVSFLLLIVFISIFVFLFFSVCQVVTYSYMYIPMYYVNLILMTITIDHARV